MSAADKLRELAKHEGRVPLAERLLKLAELNKKRNYGEHVRLEAALKACADLAESVEVCIHGSFDEDLTVKMEDALQRLKEVFPKGDE